MKISLLIFMLCFAVLGIVFLMGKGDKLIAGYNTAKPEQRKRVNIHRLRLLMAIVSFVCAAAMPLLMFGLGGAIGFNVIIVVMCVIVLWLANTWAMKHN